MLQNNCCHTHLNLKQQRLPLFQHEWMTSDALLRPEARVEGTLDFFIFPLLRTVTCHCSLQRSSPVFSGCGRADRRACRAGQAPAVELLQHAHCCFACLPNGLLSRI